MNHILHLQKLKNHYFVLRHGKSEANEKGIIISDPKGGAKSYGLSEEGKDQVRKAIKDAVTKGILDSSTVIISSDFKRTKETAEIAGEILNADKVTLEPRLRERYFGTFDKTHNSNYQKVWDDDVIDAAHNKNKVESTLEVLSRTTSLIEELEKRYLGRKILLVSHGDALQILQTGFKKISSAKHRNVPHLEVAEIREMELAQNNICL